MKSSKNNLSVDDLLSSAEPRSKMPPHAEQELYLALRDEWQSELTRRRHLRWAYALAATILVGFAGLLTVFNVEEKPLATPIAVATVNMKFDSGSPIAREVVDTSLSTGDVLRADAGVRYALSLSGGGKLRVNENTAVMLVGRQEIQLLEGSIYYDSDDQSPEVLEAVSPKNSVVVHTRRGTLRNLGTQFMVDGAGQQVTISVRSGAVELEMADFTQSIVAGEKIEVTEDNAVEYTEIPPYGSNWAWVEEALPTFTLNNAPLSTLLSWISRETGRDIEYATPAAEELAKSSLLVGTVDKLPLEAMSLWLATIADLEAHSTESTITIALRTETSQ